MNPEVAARLSRANIQVLAEANKHFLLGRGLCIALVERTEAGFGSIGSSGIMTDAGLAYLVWREGVPRLAGKGGESDPDDGQVEAILRFSADLKSALTL